MHRASVRSTGWRALLACLALVLALSGCSLLNQRSQPAGPAAAARDTATPGSPAPANPPANASPAADTSAAGSGSAAAAATPALLPATGSGQANNGAAAGVLLTNAVRDVAQKVRPAVVQITNQQQVQLGLFNQPYTVPAGVGSGVIYDNQGHIITNDHVVEGAQQLLVSLPDGRSFPAKLIGSDPQTDLAVIQISGSNLPVAQLGDSSQLQVGDWSVAIGNALALPGGPTVTAGVIGALGRTVQEPGSSGGTGSGSQGGGSAGPFLFDVIQTSAPINPGNSGGALVNLAGQVIGINTLVAGQAEPGVAAQGIGFAIAINTVKPIADQLVSAGHVVHASLGVSYVPLTPSLAARLGINQREGVVVADTISGSPAERAGLQQGDVISRVDGAQLKDESDLARILSKHKPGDKVTLTVVRNNRSQQVPVTLGELQSS